MKKSVLAICIICIFSLAILSCDIFFGDGGDGTTRTFFAQRQDGTFYSLRAELLASGKYCNVWVEVGSGVNSSTARSVANMFTTIVENMKPVFCFSKDNKKVNVGGKIATNFLELVDYLGNGDGKLCILLLDLKDSYNPSAGQHSYFAGYFWNGDFSSNNPNSNNRDIIDLFNNHLNKPIMVNKTTNQFHS